MGLMPVSLSLQVHPSLVVAYGIASIRASSCIRVASLTVCWLSEDVVPLACDWGLDDGELVLTSSPIKEGEFEPQLLCTEPSFVVGIEASTPVGVTVRMVQLS